MSRDAAFANATAKGAVLPLIIYYGPAGLESQVFQSYMASSGYRVQVVTNAEAAARAIDANPSSIAVVALDRRQHELLEQARRLSRHLDRTGRVFILSTEDSAEPAPDGVDVIPRPYRLSELVRRIQTITKAQRQGI